MYWQPAIFAQRAGAGRFDHVEEEGEGHAGTVEKCGAQKVPDRPGRARSLLGIDYKRASSYPVGYVAYLKMYGLDFEEFIWAMGITGEMLAELEQLFRTRRPVPQAVHNRMMECLRQYAAVGGMPEAVSTFVNTKDFREVDRIQRSLLQGYQYDIAHYALTAEKGKAEKCYLSLARQLLDKENHKFQYREIERGARAQKYYSSIEWLIRSS